MTDKLVKIFAFIMLFFLLGCMKNGFNEIEPDRNNYTQYTQKYCQLGSRILEFDFGGVSQEASRNISNNTYFLGLYEPVSLGEDINWTIDPFDDRSWRYKLNTLVMIEYLLDAYQKTNNTVFINKSVEIISDWQNDNFLNKNPKNEFAWYDHSVPLRLMVFSKFYHLVKKNNISLNNQFKINFFALVEYHAELLSNSSFYTHNHNHGVDQDKALILMALSFCEFNRTDELVNLAMERLESQINYLISDEGVELENSPGYHIFLHKALSELSLLIKDIDFGTYKKVKPKIDKMADFSINIIKPNKKIPIIGDSNEIIYQGGLNLKEKKLNAIYPNSGYAIFFNEERVFNQSFQLVFYNAFHSKTHKHRDELSYYVYAFGEDWIIDSGKFKYIPEDPYRQYAISGRAHNTIIINDEDVILNSNDAKKVKITDWRFNRSISFVKGEHTLYPESKIIRNIYYIRPNIIIVYDVIESGNYNKYSNLIHIDENKVVYLDKSSIIVRSLNSNISMIINSYANTSTKLLYGEVDPIQGWVSRRHEDKLKNYVVEYVKNGADTHFLTTICFEKDKNCNIRYFADNVYHKFYLDNTIFCIQKNNSSLYGVIGIKNEENINTCA